MWSKPGRSQTARWFSWQALNHAPEGAHFPQKPTLVVRPACCLGSFHTTHPKPSCQLRQPNRCTTKKKEYECEEPYSCLINSSCSTKGTSAAMSFFQVEYFSGKPFSYLRHLKTFYIVPSAYCVWYCICNIFPPNMPWYWKESITEFSVIFKNRKIKVFQNKRHLLLHIPSKEKKQSSTVLAVLMHSLKSNWRTMWLPAAARLLVFTLPPATPPPSIS